MRDAIKRMFNYVKEKMVKLVSGGKTKETKEAKVEKVETAQAKETKVKQPKVEQPKVKTAQAKETKVEQTKVEQTKGQIKEDKLHKEEKIHKEEKNKESKSKKLRQEQVDLNNAQRQKDENNKKGLNNERDEGKVISIDFEKEKRNAKKRIHIDEINENQEEAANKIAYNKGGQVILRKRIKFRDKRHRYNFYEGYG
ncbi:MAG: hypothetical protein ACRCSG_03585 [Cellulosilyticaceae bacterium]